MDGVSAELPQDIRRSINFGYLTTPSSGEIVALVTKALRTRRFSVLIEKGGGVLHDCFAVESAINQFVFPNQPGSLGSQVVFFQEPIGGKAIIIGVVKSNADRSLYDSNQYVIERISESAIASVIVDGRGRISIDVMSMNDDPAELVINVSNKTANSTVKLNVKGSVNLDVDGDITVNNKFSNTYWQCNNFRLDMNKLHVGKAEQPMVLGKELKTQIEKTNDVVKAIKDSLLNWTVAPSDGGAALKAFFISQLGTSVEGDFNKINSEKSFLD